MTIHKEGHRLVAKSFFYASLVSIAAFRFLPHLPILMWAIVGVSVAFFLIILQFFRSPSRKLTIDANAVVAPADGKVVVIEETVEEEFLKDKRIQVSIFMSPVNVHVNRNPVSGLIKFFKYHPGKFLVAWHPKSSTENERTTAVYELPSGAQILMRQIAGALAKRIVWYVQEGDKVNQCDEFGFIKFGSRVDLYLPLGTEILVNLDQKTKGGQTVIARLK